MQCPARCKHEFLSANKVAIEFCSERQTMYSKRRWAFLQQPNDRAVIIVNRKTTTRPPLRRQGVQWLAGWIAVQVGNCGATAGSNQPWRGQKTIDRRSRFIAAITITILGLVSFLYLGWRCHKRERVVGIRKQGIHQHHLRLGYKIHHFLSRRKRRRRKGRR